MSQWMNAGNLLILVTLASTVVATFWHARHWARILILALAIATSAASILHRQQAEVESKAVLSILENLVVSIAEPPEFESAFELAAKSVAENEGYPEVFVRKSGFVRDSDDQGYMLGFYDPSGHSHWTGFPEIYVYVPLAALRTAIQEFAKGRDIAPVLKEQAFWIWDGVVGGDNSPFVESLERISREAYLLAKMFLPEETKQRLKDVEPFHEIESDFNILDGSISLFAVHPDPPSLESDHQVWLTRLEKGFLDKLVGLGAIDRGRGIFRHVHDALVEGWENDSIIIMRGR